MNDKAVLSTSARPALRAIAGGGDSRRGPGPVPRAAARRFRVGLEERFAAGTAATTPPLAAVPTRWPRPWAFFNVLLVGLTAYALCVASFPYTVGPTIAVGAFAMPVAVVVLFFEVNVLRNVSSYQVTRALVLGGAVSMTIAAAIYRNVANPRPGMIGVIEESSKAAALVFVIGRSRYRWTLNGLLLGAAVGAGFAAFETMGYALNVFIHVLNEHGTPAQAYAMATELLRVRGLLSPFGHIVWTGLIGAALASLRRRRSLAATIRANWHVPCTISLAIFLHAAWDSVQEPHIYAQYVRLGLVAWAAVLLYVRAGLRQIRRAQAQTAAPVALPEPEPATQTLAA